MMINPRISLPLDNDWAGDQAQLAGAEDAELNSKQRQIQLQLQVCLYAPSLYVHAITKQECADLTVSSSKKEGTRFQKVLAV
jgi:hypothetical protein